MTTRPKLRHPKRRRSDRGGVIRPAARRKRRSPSRLRTVALRLCGSGLFLGIVLAYFVPLRRAIGSASDAVIEATIAGRLASGHRGLIARDAFRNGISYELAAAIHCAAVEEGIDSELAFRLVRVESEFHEGAVSPAGALGLTQLMPATAASLQPGITREEIFQRDTNLRLGFRYLRWLLKVYDGNIANALHAYNRGPGTVDRIRAAGRDPANGYANRVLQGGPGAAPYRGDGLIQTREMLLPDLGRD